MIGGVLMTFLLSGGRLAAHNSYHLVYNPPLNKPVHYDINIDIQGPKAASFKIGTTVKATKVDAGVFTVISTFDSVTLPVPPGDQATQAERLIKSTVVTRTVDGQGRTLTSDASHGISQLLVGGIDAAKAIAFSPKVALLKMGQVPTPSDAPQLPMTVEVDLATGVLQKFEYSAKGESGDLKGGSIHALIAVR
jgi:hypothetical protein